MCYNKPMASKSLFYFLGDDEAYFKSLQAEFTKHTRMPITFKRFYESEESKIQSLFIKINKDLPTCVFVDFSKCPQDYLHLARLFTRTKFESKILLVGLLDLLTTPAVLNESLITGLHLSHFKSPEIYDLVFDVTKLLAPEQIGEHGFATAGLKETWEAGILSKVGYVHSEGLHFETDFPLEIGQDIMMNHFWLEKKIIPSRQVKVTHVAQANLFYQFKYAVDAEFKFIDEVEKEDLSEEDLTDRVTDRLELIRRHKKLFNAWLDDNLSFSQEKLAKVLIVDKEFSFYHDQIRTDKHPFVIRSLSHIEEIEEELKRVSPQVIAVALEDEIVVNSQNNFAFLEKLVSVIKRRSSKEDWPFLVVFNTLIPSLSMQNQLDYPSLMCASNALSVEVLVKMAGFIEKKILENRTFKENTKSKVVFIKKTNAASMAEILINLQMTKVSETDVFFQSQVALPSGINLRVRSPLPFFINAQPLKSQGKVMEFQGLVHCMNEVHKKELRRYVNTVFFRDHDAQLSNEADEFKKLNEAKLMEKTEALKKAEELKAKEATDEGSKELK